MPGVSENFGGWKAATALTAAVATGSLATLLWSKVKEDDSSSDLVPQKWTKVGSVAQLILHPVKSCKGVNVQEAEATQLGFKAGDYFRDRTFMIVDQNGKLVRMSEHLNLAHLQPTIKGAEITLSAPGMADITVSIPKDVPQNRKPCTLFDETVPAALDCGAEVSAWLTTYLNEENFTAYLYYHPGDVTQRVKLSKGQKRFSAFTPSAKGAFHDETSYMFTTDESLAELNTKLETKVSHTNFRPVLVITGAPEPFAEDMWTYVKVGQNGPVFKVVQPCERCRMTSIDPVEGVMNKKGEPVRTLHHMKRKFPTKEMQEACRKSALFGFHLGLHTPGETVKVGDSVYTAIL